MVAPLVQAAALTAGTQFLGGLFDRSKNKRRNAAEIARVEGREDSRFQRASADARAAGLHPLFALGAAGAGSPQFIAGQSESGSALGDAVRGVGRVGAAHAKSKIATRDPLQQRLAELQIENAEVVLEGNKLDLTERQANLSSNQLVTQAATASQDIPKAVQADQMQNFEGLVEPTPTKVVTTQPGRPDRTAGVKPGWDRVRIHKDIKPILVPQSEEGWGEDLSIVKFAVIAAANAPSMAKFLIMLNVKTAHEGMKILKEASRRMRADKSYKRVTKTKKFKVYTHKVDIGKRRNWPR